MTDLFAGLPPWAAVLLAVLVAAVLVVLNIGWLLSAKSMLDAKRRGGGGTSAKRPPSDTDRR